MHKIDYQKYMNRDLWVLWEGIHIILEREPNLSEFVQPEYSRYKDSLFWNKFDEIAELARGSIERHILKVELDPPNYLYCEIIPSIFLSWAQTKKLNIPKEMMLLLMKTNFKENISPIPIEHSSQIINHLDKPSNNCHAKTEFILKALEDIASSLSMEINREILWEPRSSHSSLACNKSRRTRPENRRILLPSKTQIAESGHSGCEETKFSSR